MNDPKDDALAMSHLEARTMSQGVASIGMKDGQMIMFSRAYLEGMLEKCIASGKDRLIMFIAKGPELTQKDLV